VPLIHARRIAEFAKVDLSTHWREAHPIVLQFGSAVIEAAVSPGGNFSSSQVFSRRGAQQ
jgi:hypothetical protein